MADAPARPPFLRTLRISISSFAVNLVTPFVQAGGELYRAGSVTPWLGAQRATSSVVTYYMLHALSNIASWIIGIILVLSLYRLPAPLVIALAVTGAILIGLTLFIFARHQDGVVAPLIRIVNRIPLVRRLVRKLEAQREHIEGLDKLITDFYHRDRRRFFASIGLDTFGRVLSAMEFWLMARGMHLSVGVLDAVVIGTFGTLGVNIIFFVPLEAGVKEGSFLLIFTMLGLDPALGVFAAIVQRLREFAWIGIGLLLTLIERHHKSEDPSTGA